MKTAPSGMSARIEALGFRSLRYVSQHLGPFHVLVGPNGSGKSTFLDVVAFLGDVTRAGLDAAIRGNDRLGMFERAPDAQQLTWLRQGRRFELAIEISVPDGHGAARNGHRQACRYEMAVDVSDPIRIAVENLWLKPLGHERPFAQPTMFPEAIAPPATIVHPPRGRTPEGWRKIVSRGEEPERVMFHAESTQWRNPFKLGTDKAALTSLPDDTERFPVATWFKGMLGEGVHRLALASEHMRRPSPPGRTPIFRPDGSRLPHAIHALEQERPDRFDDWVRHLQEALPDLESVTTREREEDRHRYLILRYRNGLEAPSWLVSDGTLRLLALTLLAYIPGLSGMFLIEEPENGIHPRAVETAYQSLSSVYDAQVLLATHSPVIASMARLDQILCFARSQEGATAVVPGDEHPRLREWRGSMDIGTLLAAGVLG